MSRPLSLLVVGATALVTGCSEYQVNNDPDGVNGPVPDIVVSPSSLLYDELTTGEEQIQTFNVKNVGAATLNVSDVVIGSGIAYTVVGPVGPFDLEPEDAIDVDVAFTPLGANENFGQVLVLSDDPDTPEAPVDLLGYGAVPELQITPDSYVFGDTFVPCGADVDLELKNIGSENLVITDLSYTSLGLLTLDDSALRPLLPVTLMPDEARYVTVHFAASTVGSDTGKLEVASNDPRGIVAADQNGEGSYADDNVEVFTTPGVPPVDVMVLIDHSGSMQGDNQDDVVNGMPPFIAELQQVADWQLMEVTKETGCNNGGILDPSTSDPAQLMIDHAWDAAPSEPQYLTESLLQLAEVALDQTGPGQCNDGFLRPGALLHVVIISDEKDHSGQPGPFWVGEYATHVISQDFVKVSVVGDINVNCGDGTGARGYEEAADLTGGAKLNICNANWGSTFGDIASEVLDGIRTYNLAESAAPETIVVTVNGAPTTDFTYSSAGNSVTVNSPPIGEGDVVEISYGVLGEC